MYEYELQISLEAVKEGARALVNNWGKITQIRDKSTGGDLITEADTLSETIILDYLRKRFPTHGYISEEEDKHDQSSRDFVWVLDPLDGTTNYAHVYPMTAISLALLHEGKPVIGIIHNPFLDGLYHAVKGKGTCFNHNRIHVSKVSRLENSLLGSGFGYDRREIVDANYLEFCHLTNISQGVRRAGAASLDLAYVASGRLEGHWERGLKIWDIAAGVIIIEEAGGKVTGYDGEPLDLYSDRIVASNGLIHDQFIEELQKCKALENEKSHIFEVLVNLLPQEMRAR